ncbi:hypothetical protein KHU50_005321 [Colletotrichum sp. SAR 10_65]|nr:hypothetical protein KHU50_005321 [Colletotrichum sp. SAR 10_65]
MRAFSLVGLPSSLLLLITAHVGAENPTAIRKMSPNAGEKLLPDDLAFAKDVFDTPLTPHEKLLAARMADDPFLYNASYPHRPPFASHSSQAGLGWEHFRRAIDVLNLLEKRQACPTKMNSSARNRHDDQHFDLHRDACKPYNIPGNYGGQHWRRSPSLQTDVHHRR